MLSALFSVVLLMSENAASTTAATPAEAAAVVQLSETPKDERKICKREQVTGQIQGTKRVCMTAKQWEAARRARR